MTYSGGPCIVEVVREDIEIPCSRVSIFGPKAGPDDQCIAARLEKRLLAIAESANCKALYIKGHKRITWRSTIRVDMTWSDGSTSGSDIRFSGGGGEC